MPIQVLGFWWWWLFIVPSLRSRRPGGIEKQALDIAFLATPAISILSPIVTKDPQLIWLANLGVVACSYAYAFGTTTTTTTTTAAVGVKLGRVEPELEAGPRSQEVGPQEEPQRCKLEQDLGQGLPFERQPRQRQVLQL